MLCYSNAQHVSITRKNAAPGHGVLPPEDAAYRKLRVIPIRIRT